MHVRLLLEIEKKVLRVVKAHLSYSSLLQESALPMSPDRPPDGTEKKLPWVEKWVSTEYGPRVAEKGQF